MTARVEVISVGLPANPGMPTPHSIFFSGRDTDCTRHSSDNGTSSEDKVSKTIAVALVVPDAIFCEPYACPAPAGFRNEVTATLLPRFF